MREIREPRSPGSAQGGSSPQVPREAGSAAVESLVAAFRRDPGRFADPAALAEAAGLDEGVLREELRRLYQSTPEGLLRDARLTAARLRLARNGASLGALADDLGYPSLADFRREFRASHGLDPQGYRALAGTRELNLELPQGYPTARILRYLGREHDSLTVRVEGSNVAAAVRLAGRPAILRIELRRRSVRIGLETRGRLRAGDAAEAFELVRRLLGLSRGPEEFERRVAGEPRLAPLLDGRRGLRIPLVADPFDGLIWVIVGQQISLPFAYALRRVLVEAVGEPAGCGLSAPPTPEAVAELPLEQLTAARYSRRKAEYLLGVAQQLAAGELRFDRLREAAAPAIEARLLAVRGLGPWSVQYLLMRVFGFEDCLPVGDAGLARALQRFFALASPPDGRRMQELMEPFAPHRSWATFYLWQSLEKRETTT